MKKVPMRFAMKHVKSRPITKQRGNINHIEQTKLPTTESVENKEEKEDDKVMDTKEKIELVNAVLGNEAPIKAKRIRKDKSLIERTGGSTIILTEENKELLHD